MERSSRGQASVELALVIPVLVLLAVALIQLVVVARDRVQLVRVTAASARAAMVDPDDRTVAATARALRGGLDLERVECSGGRAAGELLTVSVMARPQRLPLVGAALGGLRLSESLTVRVEG